MEKRRKIIQLLCMTIMSYVVLSCNDEIYNDNESQNNRVIAFQTTMKNWTEQYEEATTRGKDAMQRNYQVFPVKGFDTPLQLVAITGDDIDNEKSLSKLTRVEQTDTSGCQRFILHQACQ